jgi:hypothetical protein
MNNNGKETFVEFTGKIFNDFNWGFFLVQKFFWIINLAILVKVYNISFYIQLIAIPVMVIGIWLLGKLIVKTGIQKSFINNRFKDSKVEKND